MNLQYKASYLIKSVFDDIRDLTKNEHFKFKLLGLLESTSTFDVITNINLTPSGEMNSLLAVANNIITRGTPTLASKLICQELSFLKDNFTSKDYYNALHILDTRSKANPIYKDDLESGFEKSFLENIIPEDKKYLVQLFQHQREKSTLSNNKGDHGKVDFCFEVPYYSKVDKQTVFLQPKSLKERTAWIIEIDGKKYHNVTIDDLRDYETAKFGNTTSRISETASYTDTTNLIKNLTETEYLKVIKELQQLDFDRIRKLHTYVLTPIAIARLQKIINHFLIVKWDNCKSKIKIAILERDIPCGHLAVKDLNNLYLNLNALTNNTYPIPEIETTIFSNKDYYFESLQPEYSSKKISKLTQGECSEYDLVIDISILWRKGVFEHDKDYLNIENSVIIRSSHFTKESCTNNIYCANQIQYRDITKETSNENHEVITEALPFIKYFLNNIFYKDEFRDGQLPILNRALRKQTVIGLLPTGGGKSLTYQLAALLQPGITIIIDPIKSLMVDQYESLLDIGIDKCDFINSILNREERDFIQNQILSNGRIQFLFCSPERLVIKEFRDALIQTNKNNYYFSYCVIDEAHCVSEWGHDFRTPYLNLGENAIKYCKTIDETDVTIFGLTATASFDVLADIERELKVKSDGKSVIRYENTVRDEIFYQIIPIKLDNENPNTISVGELKLKKAEALINSIHNQNKYFETFNKKEILKAVLQKTFKEYTQRTDLDEREFINKKAELILIDKDNVIHRNNDKFNYGVIIFCPHRNSELGVSNYVGNLNLPKDVIVSFTGGNGERGNDLSFLNLKPFKENLASVMVATKAFGMGIDKPNVRLTIHNNLSSSIESFVQESGRAGRDGKVALSVVLYNNDKFVSTNTNELISRDIQVLKQFYKKSFKGISKEKTIVREILDGISFPNESNIERLTTKINNKLNQKIRIKCSNTDNYIYIYDENENSLINIRLSDKKKYINTTNYDLANSIQEIIQNEIPNFNTTNESVIRNYLNGKKESNTNRIGIEKIYTNQLNFDFDCSIIIPFSNEYYSKSEVNLSIISDELAFEKHFQLFLENWNSQIISEITLREKFKNAILSDKDFSEFITDLPFGDTKLKEQLINNSNLAKAYFSSRAPEDTAKAIYRLNSVGIIQTYTINFQDKLYNIWLNPDAENTCLENFEELVRRYTSNAEATKVKEHCKKDLTFKTNIRKCLNHLTDFIYNKIGDKRKSAIYDMVRLCEDAITENNPLQQSEKIKENIFYYFNSKYSRVGNMAKTSRGEINADLNSEIKLNINNKNISKTIWYYIEDVIPNDTTAEFKNNIKHLRGATTKLLNSKIASLPHINILKSYSLFILSMDSAELKKEAIKEFKFGIKEWNENFPVLNFEQFFKRFKNDIKNKYNHINDEYFEDIDDEYQTSLNLKWIKEFNKSFLIGYNNAITRSN
jgi:ATP-dependent DNA helicase RecQ